MDDPFIMIHLQHQKKWPPFLSNALKCICFSSPVGRNEPSALPPPSPPRPPLASPARTAAHSPPRPLRRTTPLPWLPKYHPSCLRCRGPGGVPPPCIQAERLVSLAREIPLCQTLPRARPAAAEAASFWGPASSAGLSPCRKNTPTVPNIPSPEA